MRPLEITLIVLCALVLLRVFLPMHWRSVIRLFPALLVGVLALQLVFEKSRWQMVPIYILAAVLFLTALPEMLGRSRATPNNGVRSATPNNGVRSATPNNGVRSATPNNGVRSATPNNGVRSATPKNGIRSATPNNGVRSATPNNGIRSATPKNGIRSATPTRPRRWPAVVGLALLALLCAPPILFPVPRLPTPTGPYKVGTSTFYWVDNSRDETYAPQAGGKRQIMVQVWYPADPKEDAQPGP
jgi:hypothetical protein